MSDERPRLEISVVCTSTIAPHVLVQPRVRVHRWRVYPCVDEQILVCEIPETGLIRVTSAVAHWNTTSNEIVTQSGRVYELVGVMADDSLDFRLRLAAEL